MRKEKNKYNSIKPILISDGVDDKRKATCQNSIKNSIAESHVYKVFIDAHSIYLLYGIPSINEQSDSCFNPSHVDKSIKQSTDEC